VRGKPGFKGCEVGIDRSARVGGFGWETEKRAGGARFSRTKSEGTRIWVEEDHLGWGKLVFKGWEVGINRRAREGGDLEPKAKTKPPGLGFGQQNAEGLCIR